MEDPLMDTTWMGRSFIIMDNLIHDDHAKTEDIPLFFYPKIEIETQIHTLLVCLAITSLSGHCTNSPVTIAGLRKVKMAYKRDGEYTIVLTGDIRDSNKALLHHVELLYESFLFNCGGFDVLEKTAKGDRPHLQKVTQEAGNLLIPLIENFHQSAMKFSPMPYVKMNPTYKATSNFFVQAWQLTCLLENSPQLAEKLYGTALMFHDRVVCTHLDVSSTRWIVNLITSLLDLQQNDTEPKSEFGVKRVTCPVYLSKNAIREGKPINEKETLQKAGLVVISLPGGLRIASVLTWESFSAPHIDLIMNLLSSHQTQVDHLTATLNKTASVVPIRGSLRRSESGRAPTLLEKSIGRHEDDGLPVVLGQEEINRGKTVWMEGGRAPYRGWDQDEVEDHNIGGFNDDSVNDRPYNFFAFDGMTERQTEHRGNFRTEAETNFNASINWARDLFSERPEVTKLVLRNHSGTILCKKNFGKESFFQSSVCKLEDIDLISRDYLSADYNTTFM